MENLSYSFFYLTAFRLIVTIFVISWGVIVSKKYADTTNKEIKDNVAFTHKVWFGNNSILTILMYLWIVTIILLAFFPTISNIVKTYLE